MYGVRRRDFEECGASDASPQMRRARRRGVAAMNVRRSLAFGAPVLVGTIAAVLSIGGAAGASTGFSLSPRHAAPTAMTQTVIASVRVSSHSDFDRITFTF